MSELYAICRQNGHMEVRHVQLTQQLQAQLDGVFADQEALFWEGINGEVDFTGDWKPDEDELLVIKGLPEVGALVAASHQNALALPVLDVANFQNEAVKALFVVAGHGAARRLLLQYFSSQQLLSGRLAMLYDGNVFRRLTEPAFAMGNQIAAVVNSGGEIRFKSYAVLRRILDITPVFRQATDTELQALCNHNSLSVNDVPAFIALADEILRKNVMAIIKSKVLDDIQVQDIESRAISIGFPISVSNGKVDIPQDRREAKAIFSFLLNKVYRGPISQQLFITNSNRPLI